LLEVRVSGVEVGASLGLNAVFLATDNTDLNFEDDVGSAGLGQQFLCDLEVLIDWNSGTIPHVRLEEWELSAVNALLGDSQQGADELVQNLLLAVVGVQRNVDAVALGSFVCEGSQCDST